MATPRGTAAPDERAAPGGSAAPCRPAGAIAGPAARLLLALLIAIHVCIPAARAGEETPEEAEVLTNETIVRLVMHETPASTIVLRIRREPSRFDVQPEILSELREAGVPEEVIREMVAAAAKSRRPRPAEAPQTPATGAAAPTPGTVEIDFDDDPALGPAANSVMMPEKLERKGSLRGPVPAEMAFAVVCTDPTHVPDDWEHKTHLDESFMRHKLLFLHEGQEAATGKGEKGMVFVPHPASWSFPAEPGLHRGIISFVVRMAGDERYTPVAAAEFDSLEVRAGEITRVHLRVRTLSRSLPPKGKGGEAKLPDDSYVSIGTVGRERKGLVPSVEVEKVDPPAPPEPAAEPSASDPPASGT